MQSYDDTFKKSFTKMKQKRNIWDHCEEKCLKLWLSWILYNRQHLQAAYFRYMWGVQQWPRWLSKHHKAAAVINRWPQLPTSKIRPKLAPTDVSENRTQITSNFCPLLFNFLSVFINWHTKREITSNFCRPANGQFRITQRLSRLSHFIFQSPFSKLIFPQTSY